MPQCLFIDSAKGSRCQRCGYRLKMDYAKPPLRNCPGERGLGDVVADWIHRLTRIKPCGGCRKRQAWLNRLGRRLTRAAGDDPK